LSEVIKSVYKQLARRSATSCRRSAIGTVLAGVQESAIIQLNDTAGINYFYDTSQKELAGT
jgi:hypothetical protein